MVTLTGVNPMPAAKAFAIRHVRRRDRLALADRAERMVLAL
jgi:hypothetical protein